MLMNMRKYLPERRMCVSSKFQICTSKCLHHTPPLYAPLCIPQQESHQRAWGGGGGGGGGYEPALNLVQSTALTRWSFFFSLTSTGEIRKPDFHRVSKPLLMEGTACGKLSYRLSWIHLCLCGLICHLECVQGVLLQRSTEELKLLHSGSSALSDRSPDHLPQLHWPAFNSSQPIAHPDAWMSHYHYTVLWDWFHSTVLLEAWRAVQWRGSTVWHTRGTVTIQLAASIFAPPPHDLHQQFLLTVNLCKATASVTCAVNASNMLIGWKGLLG